MIEIVYFGEHYLRRQSDQKSSDRIMLELEVENPLNCNLRESSESSILCSSHNFLMPKNHELCNENIIFATKISFDCHKLSIILLLAYI